jgi:hypothetical protein
VDRTHPLGGIRVEIPELAHYDPEVTRANTSRPAGVTASGNGTGERVPNQGDQ